MNRTMKRVTGTLAVSMAAILAVALLAGAVMAQGPMGVGRGGMMDSRPNANKALPYGTGSGWDMMGNMMGRMMGGWYGLGSQPGSTAQRLSSDQVEERVYEYLKNFSNSEDLKAVEIMEFEDNFYAEIQEKSTGINAFELLIDPYSGNVWPEFGPNMMWNIKYGMMGAGTIGGSMMGMMGGGMMGMMGGGMMDGYDWSQESPVEPSADMPVKPEDAVKYAQQYLDKQNTDLTAADHADRFYGYYTVHTLDKDGKTQGMLSVNGYSGRVWYHTWHGEFIGMTEHEES